MKNKINTKAFSNLIGGIVFCALGVWALIQTFGFQQLKNNPVQPALFPQIMSIGLIIFSAIVILQSALKLSTLKEGDPIAEPTGSINILKNKGVQAAVLVIALCILFVALFDMLGYVLCSAAIGIVIMYLIGKRDVKVMLLVGILVPLGMWLVFYKFLSVNIPMGVLQPLKDLIDII